MAGLDIRRLPGPVIDPNEFWKIQDNFARFSKSSYG